ncbi:MAG: hypothetical protein AB1589_45590 [Cyanobacteriota bacterium]
MAKRIKRPAQREVKVVRLERRGRTYLVGVAEDGSFVSWKKESPAPELPKLNLSVSDGVDPSA